MDRGYATFHVPQQGRRRGAAGHAELAVVVRIVQAAVEYQFHRHAVEHRLQLLAVPVAAREADGAVYVRERDVLARRVDVIAGEARLAENFPWAARVQREVHVEGDVDVLADVEFLQACGTARA